METVFITIHDLSLDARIKYVSESVEDILGYLPHEVKGKSCWEYFHPEEIPFARAIHGRGIHLDKAAVLNYCRIKHKDGSWIGCECVFTVVHDVLVASTSIYSRGPRSSRRAVEAPAVRRLFSTSPRDARYHMLSYMSTKFYKEPSANAHEPRAALFLNRFTRTSTIMFATNGVANILGVDADRLTGKSFYFCIAETCLSDAVRCVESAKANDSIAYLRFWYRNPLLEDDRSRDASMPDVHSSDEDEDGGGVRIHRGGVTLDRAVQSTASSRSLNAVVANGNHPARPPPAAVNNSRSSSENSAGQGLHAPGAIFDIPPADPSRSSASSVDPPSDDLPLDREHIEIEAVVSCTSDGLVVVLRRARPLMPYGLGPPDSPNYANGLFAAPWGSETNFSGSDDVLEDVPPSSPSTAGVPLPVDGVMDVIRDVAAFAWSLTGINGKMTDYARGEPSGEAQPPGGLPIWDPKAESDAEDRWNGFSGSACRPINAEQIKGFKDEVELPPAKPNQLDKAAEESSSEDEILWMRAKTMPEWRRPPRRAHRDAFGSEAGSKDNEDGPTRVQRRRLDQSGS